MNWGRSPFSHLSHPNPNPNSYSNPKSNPNLILTLILTLTNPNLNSNPTLTLLRVTKVRKWTRAMNWLPFVLLLRWITDLQTLLTLCQCKYSYLLDRMIHGCICLYASTPWHKQHVLMDVFRVTPT